MAMLPEKKNEVCTHLFKMAIWMPVAAAYLLLMSPSTSPLYVTEGIDSAVFKTMGSLILKGGVPYADLFDNKGPILYLINALGLCIGGNTGLLLLQVIGFAMALYAVYRTVRLFAPPIVSCVSVAAGAFIYTTFIQEGNQCEEWILYFVCPVAYHVCRRLSENGKINGFVVGLCFGTTLFIRPSDAVALVGGMLVGAECWLVWKKQRREAVRMVGMFACGALAVALPIVVWFWSRRALGDLWYGVVGINMTYTGGLSMLSTATNRVKLSLLLFFVTFGALIWTYGRRRLLFVFVPMLALWLLSMGFKFYFHYYIVLFPVLTLYCGLLFCQRSALAVVALAVLLLTPQTYEMRPLPRMARKTVALRVCDAFHSERQQPISTLYHEAKSLFAHIPENERDSVWNGNVGADEQSYYRYSVFFHCGIIQQNRQVGDFAGVNVDKPLFEEGNFPLWIVVDKKAPCRWCDHPAFAACYRQVATTVDTAVIDMAIYRRLK